MSADAAATRSARSATSNVQYQFWTSVRTITDAAAGKSATAARNDYATTTSTDELLSKTCFENETSFHQNHDAATAETHPFSSWGYSFSPKVDTSDFAETIVNKVDCILKSQVKALKTE